jgi:hypothetical protein
VVVYLVMTGDSGSHAATAIIVRQPAYAVLAGVVAVKGMPARRGVA